MKTIMKIYNGLAFAIGHCILAVGVVGAVLTSYIVIEDVIHNYVKENDTLDDVEYIDD